MFNRLFLRSMANDTEARKTPLEQVAADFPQGATIQVNGEEYHGPATVTKVSENLLGTPLVHISRYEGDTEDYAFYAHECEKPADDDGGDPWSNTW